MSTNVCGPMLAGSSSRKGCECDQGRNWCGFKLFAIWPWTDPNGPDVLRSLRHERHKILDEAGKGVVRGLARRTKLRCHFYSASDASRGPREALHPISK